jgi:hypothetical protein
MKHRNAKILLFEDLQLKLARHLSECDACSTPRESLWRKHRLALIGVLKHFGEEDAAGIGEGDFSVGSDWFATNCLRVVDYRWKIMRANAIGKIQHFLSVADGCYAATIARSWPAELSGIEVVITQQEVFSSIYGKSLKEIIDICKLKNLGSLL